MNQLKLMIAVASMSVNLAFGQAAPATQTDPPKPPAPAASTPKVEKKVEKKAPPPPKPAPVAPAYYTSKDECVAAMRAGKAAAYQPTGRHPKASDARIAGLTKRPLEADACVHLDTMASWQWVFQKQGTEVYTSGTKVVYLAECQNDINEVVYLKKEEPLPAPAPVASAPVATTTTVTKTIFEILIVNQEVRCMRADGTYVLGAMKDNRPQCPELQINTPVHVHVPIRVSESVAKVPAASQASTPATATCANTSCVPKEKVTVEREEKRSDGRCFSQTNMGYMFEVRANTSSGILMVALVNPQTLQRVDGTKPMQVDGVLAAKTAQGYDCDGMQAQLYQRWEMVRGAYELPSACKLTTAATARRAH